MILNHHSVLRIGHTSRISHSKVSSNSFTSWVLAPERATDRGRFFSSVSTLRFAQIFPRSVGLFPTDRGPVVLLPCNRPNLSIPNRSLPTHRIFPAPLPKFFQKPCSLPFLEGPMYGTYRYHIPSLRLSIDSQLTAHRISFPIPSLLAKGCAPDQGYFCMFSSNLVPFSEYHP